MPTISSLLGLAAPEDIDGHDLTQPPPLDRTVLVESHYGELAYGWARLAAIYRNGLKYVDGPEPEFYDLSVDPSERDNLVDRREEAVGELRARLVELRGDDADRLPSSSGQLDAEALARLAALGYVSADREVVSAKGWDAPDPKQMLPQLTHMLELMTGPDHGQEVPGWADWLLRIRDRAPPRDQNELLAALEALAREAPDFAPVHLELSSLYERTGRSREALESRMRFESLLQNGRALPPSGEGASVVPAP